jgi:hypothetical protein
VRRTRLLRTASFRLATLYLALFAASTVALGSFVYWSIRQEILAGFDEGIVEERDALQHVFTSCGRDALTAVLDARAASGGRPTASLLGPDTQRLGGDVELPPSAVPTTAGWFDFVETDMDQTQSEDQRHSGRSRRGSPTAHF